MWREVSCRVGSQVCYSVISLYNAPALCESNNPSFRMVRMTRGVGVGFVVVNSASIHSRISRLKFLKIRRSSMALSRDMVEVRFLGLGGGHASMPSKFC